MKKIIIINGPNLNLLGSREVEIYGDKSLNDIISECQSLSANLNLEVSFFQSNSESEIIDKEYYHHLPRLDILPKSSWSD